MWIFTDAANWFDKQKKRSNVVFDQMVEDSDYSQGAMLMAATGHAVMEFGGSFVDLLRLGDGFKEGSWKGVGTDFLRVVAVFPVGKAAKFIHGFRGIRNAQFVTNISGPVCSWVNSAKALAHVRFKDGGKLFASVDDLAKVLGLSLQRLEPAYLSAMLNNLSRIGARVGALKIVSSLREVESMIPRDGSVLLVSVRIVEKARKAGKARSHAIYFYRDVFGRIRIMDRTVGEKIAPAVTRGAYRSLDELVKRYANVGVAKFIPYEAAVLHNVYVPHIAHETTKLVIPIPAVIAEYKDR